ncbi:MAG: hypothetical protein AAFQ10_06865 [Pseudomonadota bacterium]
MTLKRKISAKAALGKKWLNASATLLPIICAIGLSGCTMMTVGGATETCAGFQPIPWSKLDTPQTIIEIKSHNAVWKRFCQ